VVEFLSMQLIVCVALSDNAIFVAGMLHFIV